MKFKDILMRPIFGGWTQGLYEVDYLCTYTQLRDFLDKYTNDYGEIQGDPATIAAEAVTARHVEPDDEFYRQHEV